MPVHRMPGVKGRVYAYVTELETWRIAGSVAAPPDQSEITVVEPRPSRFWLRLGLACGGISLAAIAIAWALRPRVNPNHCTVEGRTAVVYDANGREAWRYSFPSVPVLREGPNAETFDSFRLVDVDGDGRRDLLFPLQNEPNSPDDDTLYLFASDGALRWKRQFARKIETGKIKYDGPFSVRRFALVPIPGRKESRVLVVANHRVGAPTLVSLLDMDGNLLREYWHSGHVASLLVTDHDLDGRPEIYLGGIANGYECADLTVLDPEKFSGASDEATPDAQILNVGPRVEKARLLFPRSTLNQALNPYNATDFLMRSGANLVVGTNENPAGVDKAEDMFYFAPRLVLERARPADINQATYNKLHAQGEIPSTLTEAEIESYRNIRFLTAWSD